MADKFEKATGKKTGNLTGKRATVYFSDDTKLPVKLYFNNHGDSIEFARYVFDNFKGIDRINIGNELTSFFEINENGETVPNNLKGLIEVVDDGGNVEDFINEKLPKKTRNNFEAPVNHLVRSLLLQDVSKINSETIKNDIEQEIKNIVGEENFEEIAEQVKNGLERNLSNSGVARIKKLAEQHSKPEIKQMLEDNKKELRKAFIENTKQNSSGKKENESSTAGIKFAGKGELTEIFRNAKRLSENELNNKQKMWLDFGEQSGFKVVWLDAHKNLFGAVEDGIIYLNANSNKNTAQTFHHEQFHILSALNPKLHSEIIDYFVEKFDKKQIENYRKNNQREDLTDAEVVEEILSDNFEQVQKRVKLLREMSKENPSLLKRFVAFMKNLVDKFVSAFRKPEGGMTREQSDIFVKKFNSLADSLVLNLPKNSNLKTDLKFSAENSVDNQQNLNDNVENNNEETTENEILKRLDKEIDQINDDMDIGEVREKLLRAENITVGQALKMYERLSNSKNVDKKKLDNVRNGLKEAVSYANELRREFEQPETLRACQSRLQRQNKGRKGSRLAESFQQQLDRGRIRTLTGRERVQVDQIPGEYNRMYDKINKIFAEETDKNANKNHSEKQGDFLVEKSLDDEVKAELKRNPTYINLVKNLGGEIINGELVAKDSARKKIAKQLANRGKEKHLIAWHGTNRNFDRFLISKVGNGSEVNRYGYGLYFGSPKIGNSYKRQSEKIENDLKTLYKVDIDAKERKFLDWEKPLSEQSNFVKNALDKLAKQENLSLNEKMRGDEIYRAVFLKYAPDSEYFDDFAVGEYKTEARKTSELLNSYGIKGIRSNNIADEGLIHVVFDDKIVKILEKYSENSINNFVADEELNPQQKLLKEFSGKMGATLQFFRNDNTDFHGAFSGDVIYLNAKSNIALGKVFWHETLHWLKSNNEKLYNELTKAVNLSDEQLQNYLDTTGRKDLKTNAEITEEILADSLHKLLDKVQDKSLLQKVMAWIQDAFTKFKEMFHNPKGGLTNAQLERLTNAFVRMAKDFRRD